jgi:phosphate transport system protein
MKRHFDEELKNLKEKLFKMGLLVEGSIDLCSRALFERNNDLAYEVMKNDKKIDQLELEIDEECLRLLALRQPTAVDLRLISMVMRAIHDLERMGDQAVNIAEKAIVTNQEPPLKPYSDLPKMAEIAQIMVRESINAFVEADKQKAQDVLKRDDEMDTLNEKIFKDLQELMKKTPDTVNRCVSLIMVAHNLERLGDLATNLAEDVIYVISGQDIRHHKAEQF